MVIVTYLQGRLGKKIENVIPVKISWNNEVFIYFWQRKVTLFLVHILSFLWNVKASLLIHTTCFIQLRLSSSIQLQRVVPLTLSLALWSNQWGWISGIPGSLLWVRAAWGSGLASAASGVQFCWEADGFRIGDTPPPLTGPLHCETEELEAAGLQLVCVPSEQEAMALLPPKAECFHIIFHWVTVFCECPNSFKMTFLCGLMF